MVKAVSTNLLDLAKQGNADAIATLINNQLQSKGINAKVNLQGSCIYVLLESATVPDQKVVAPFVFQGMLKLAIKLVDSLQVYGKQTSEKRPSWSQLYSLSQTKPSVADKVTKNTQNLTTDAKSSDSVNSLDKITDSGNIESITTHLNRTIADEKVTIKLIQEDKVLKIIAKTDQFLNGSVFAERIYNELKIFDLSEFETLGIYKQKIKSSQYFQLQFFSLASSEQKTSESKDIKASTIYTQGAATASSKSIKPQPQSRKGTKPKVRAGRILGVVVIVVVAAFIIIRLFMRILMLVLLSPVLGSFSVILGMFFLWRNYSLLMFLFQKLLSLLVE